MPNDRFSGMNAAALRLQISAGNVANVQSSGPLPDSANAGSYPPAYNTLTINQTAMPDGTTFATVTPVLPGTVKTWNRPHLTPTRRAWWLRPMSPWPTWPCSK